MKLNGKRHKSDATKRNEQDSARRKYMPSDRVACDNFREGNVEKYFDYAENAMDYVEMLI